MKKLILTAVLLVSCLVFKADAQLRISLGFNIGSQPDWGPTGYDHVSYYYMPDIDAYYDVPNHQYVYLENNSWIHGPALPARYHFDPYNSYKVVVNDRNPWERATTYRTKYRSFRGRRGQTVIRDSHDTKYRNHWQGNNGGGNNGHSNNGHYDHGNKGHDDHGRGNGHDDHGNNGHDDHGNNNHGNNNHGNNGHDDHGNNDHGNKGHDDHGRN
jgi:hypothetical protein